MRIVKNTWIIGLGRALVSSCLLVAMVVVFLPKAAALISTSTVLIASPVSSTLGSTVTLTATISPTTATGKITFYDGVTPVGVSLVASGQAVLKTTFLPSGSHTLKAYYSGDGSFAPSTSAAVTETITALPSTGFALPVNYDTGGGHDSGTSVALGDFNGDGKVDIVTSNVSGSTTGTVSVLLGNGDGTFQPPIMSNAGPSADFVAVGDFNGDGIADLAVADDRGDTVHILLGNGDGTFQAPITYSVAHNPGFIAVGDFNRDGKLDIAVVSLSGSVCILLGNGDGTFQSAVTYNLGGTPFSAAVGDFNGDGVPDLAIPNISTNNVSVLLGNGDGTFQAPLNFSGGMDPLSVAVADLNGDGKMDLAVADGQAGVSVLLGNGDGTFQAPRSFNAGVGPITIDVEDFNGDGKPDLAVLNFNSNTLSILIGNGDGTFQAPKDFVAPAHYMAAAADLDGDGKPDIVFSDYQDGTVGVLLPPSITPSTVTVTGETAAYGGTVNLSAKLTAGQVGVSGEVISFALNGNPAGTATTDDNGIANLVGVPLTGTTAGAYPTGISASFAGDNNFVASMGQAQLTVNTASLTIAASSTTKTLDASNPAFTATYSGFVSGDGPSGLVGNLTCSSTAMNASPVGSYPIVCSGQSSPNYTITYVSGTLTVLYVSAGSCFGDAGHAILPPISSAGTSVFKMGSTVPAKFRVCDANGIPIGTPGVVTSFFLTETVTGTVTDVNEPVQSTNPDTAFRWDPTAEQWIFNMATSGLAPGTTYVFTVTLNDGTAIKFGFGVKN